MEKRIEDELWKIFPVSLRTKLHKVNWATEHLEEIRIRVGQPIAFLYGRQAKYLHAQEDTLTEDSRQGYRLQTEQMQEMMLYLCEYSRYAYANQVKKGYISLEGGIRVGIAGETVFDENRQIGVEYPMFFNIRIPGERIGCGQDLLPLLCQGNHLYHTLLLAPPGEGKTTLLRDLIRQISMESWCRSISVLDERYEIAGCCKGVPQNDVGLHCDVYTGGEKAITCMQAVRTMAPQVIAMDEIGGWEEAKVIAYAMRCGVSILATMHAASWQEFQMIKSQQKVWQQMPFERFLFIHHTALGERSYRLYDAKGRELCVRS